MERALPLTPLLPAGCAGSFKSFLDADPTQLAQVVQTNLLGALLCTRAALQVSGGGRGLQGGGGVGGPRCLVLALRSLASRSRAHSPHAPIPPQVMRGQEGGGHVWNVDGAGADGNATPHYAAYGATKAGIAHLMNSLAAECSAEGVDVGVHTLSPGARWLG